MRIRPGLVALLLPIGLAACAADAPLASEEPVDPMFAKNQPPLSTEWLIEDLAGVASDGHGGYVDAVCGVSAYVYLTAGGNGHLGPADSRSRCGYVRTVP